MQRDIEDEERLIGSLHNNPQQTVDDGVFNAVAEQVAAQKN